jgi:hypothetical protein
MKKKRPQDPPAELTTPSKNLRFFFDRPVWTNSTKTATLHPLVYFEPRSLPEMEMCVAKAINEKLHVRAVGAGHSFSDAPLTEDILVGTTRLVKVTRYSTTNPNLVEVEAGITVRKLNKKLDDLQLSIRAMGGFDEQTIAGAILTGTHGSSLTFGAISQMVKSVVLVTNDLDVKDRVRSYRIEGIRGITDPATYPKDQPTLIQDDDVFNSVVVSFGAMGLIHSLVLEVEPTYYLDEKRVATTWPEVKKRLRGDLLTSGDSVFVQINPYTQKEGAPEDALIMTHHRLNANELTAWREDARWFFDALWTSMRSPLLMIAGHFRITYWWLVWRINRRKADIGKILRSAIRAQRDRSYKNKAHRVMYQGAAYFKKRAYDSECALPIADIEWTITVLDELLVYLRHLNDTYRSRLSAPIGLRFLKASPLYLTPEHDRDVCYVDCPVLKHAYGHNNIVGRLQHFWQEKKAIPHWGKRNELFTSEHTALNYKDFGKWLVHYRRFNANGIFSNAFTKRVVEADPAVAADVVEAPPKPVA